MMKLSPDISERFPGESGTIANFAVKVIIHGNIFALLRLWLEMNNAYKFRYLRLCWILLF